MTETYVLDASALLCLIRNEPGAERVAAALPQSHVGAVNLGEVIAKMVELGMSENLIDQVLDPLQLRVVPFDAGLARASGLLRAATRALGLSFGDRACLALAADRGAVALTTDRSWRSLDALARVDFAR